MPQLTAIIVSYNTRELTLRCLATLALATEGITHEVIVVDNASADGSAAAIRAAFPAVRVIDNPVNAGFGAANNLGIAASTGDTLLLLNSDAFPAPDAVWTMIGELRDRPKTGIVGPRLLNADGSLQRSVFRFPSPWQALLENFWLSRGLARVGLREDYERWSHDAAASVPWVIGACLLVRRSVIDAVGGFDERFFMYSEETDWQRRVRDAGFDIRFTPAARVTHVGGASGEGDKPRVNRAFFESLDLYTTKHHGRLGLFVLRGAMVAGCAMRGALWWGVALARGGARRSVAGAKASFHWWLARRQLFTWTIPRGRQGAATP